MADFKDAASVIARLAQEYGPGYSNGVYAILAHDNLPEHFGKSEWRDWFFKPSPAAFEKAHDMGLIAPWKLGSKWTMTDLGRLVAAQVQCEMDA